MFNLFESIRRTQKLKRIANKKPDVWVLPEQKLAYIKLHKVASRSIKTTLVRYILEKKGELVPDVIDLEVKNKIDAEYAHYLSTQTIFEMREEYFIASMVRNPLARLYSCYADKVVNYREKGKKNILSFYGIHLDMSFDDFVHRIAEIPDPQSNTHFRSMHPFLMHNGEMIPHKVLRLEQIDSQWPEMQNQFPGLSDLPAINVATSVSNKKIYRSVYTRELAEIAYKRYFDDINIFGYYEEVRNFINSLK